MAKGVKKIKFVEGKSFPKLSVPNQILVIPPDELAYFKVSEWFQDTTEAEKKKEVTWIWQTQDRKTIIRQKTILHNEIYGVQLPKSLCGSFYYLEASIFGKQNSVVFTGFFFKGHCDKKIISSKWSTTKGGASIKNKNKNNYISYGHIVHLHLETEGLNSNKVTIEIYNQQTLWADKHIRTITDVAVEDGQVNLKINNTAVWQGLISNIQDVEEFYVKVKDQATGVYLKDNKNQDLHAIYLNIKNKLVSTSAEKPENLTPLKVGQPNVKATRYEPCKFDQINITETEKKDGSVEQKKVLVFDKGKGLKDKPGTTNNVTHPIYFEFDSAVIGKQSNEDLNDILKFLLEHENSTINLAGFACVIGKKNHNNVLSQKRADEIKKFLFNGGLKSDRIIAVGKGEVNATDDKQGADNIRYKDEKNYQNNRRVDISFQYQGHSAHTITYETIAPSKSKDILVEVLGHTNKACYAKPEHTKKIIVKSSSLANAKLEKAGSSLPVPVKSMLSAANPAPLQYIWPKYNVLAQSSSATIYNVYINTCRYFSNPNEAIITVNAYPDIKWTLEFKWNHTQAFAYTFGAKLHPHDIKTGKEKVIGSAIDRGFSNNFGEMSQSFGLSLAAEWNDKVSKVEVGKDFGEKIAKTLALFNKIKKMTETISNSPLTKGKVMFEIKAPVIAFSAQWYLERAKEDSIEVATMVAIGVSAKPLVEAEFTINLFKIFVETAGNGICPGAGTVITWVLDKLGSNAGIHFLIIFSGGINVDGKVTLYTSYPKETKGEIKATGKIQVVVEFKAWAKGGSANIGVDGVIKADVSTSVTGGVKVGADKTGIFSSPVAEFGGVKATFVAAATVKFGILKRTFTYEGESILVKPDEIKFSKYYLNV